MLYNNLEGFLLACFPVCRKILGKRRWDRLARAFLPRPCLPHALSGGFPKSSDIPAGRLAARRGHSPVPAELAHYEWVELELDTSDRDRSCHPTIRPATSPRAGPVEPCCGCSPTVGRPAHASPAGRATGQPTFILAFRDAGHRVRFTLINPVTARLLNLFLENPELSGLEAIAALEFDLSSRPASCAPGAELPGRFSPSGRDPR
ncbi:MAG: putative DNA-binding domain-containing protein [Hydrogenophilales bacterium]|nr:putative DNA-binding domain-containing protein [Hydrogenophilales bacterium]